MGDIIDVDFGKSTNQATRNFLSLIGKLQAYEDDVLKRPLYYLSLASDRIAKMNQALRESDDAATHYIQVCLEPSDLRPTMMETMVVDKRKYQALEKAAKIVSDALHK